MSRIIAVYNVAPRYGEWAAFALFSGFVAGVGAYLLGL